jgi:hypothetical protein
MYIEYISFLALSWGQNSYLGRGAYLQGVRESS